MKHLALVFLLLFCLCAALPAADWVALQKGAIPGALPTIRTISSDVTSTVLQITVPGFWAEKTPQGWVLSLPDGSPSMVEGRPELPFLGCTVALPELKTPTFIVRSADFRLPGNYRVRMAPKPELEGQTNLPTGPIATSVDYPAAQTMMVHTGYWREVPQASLQIYPFKAKGDGTLTGAAANMIVEVLHNTPPANWPRMIVPVEFREILKHTCVNGATVNTITSPLESAATEYLVLGPANLQAGVAPLMAWRNAQGYQTEFVALTTTNPTTIKGLIQTRYATNKLKHVVLLGDYAQIPYYSWSGTHSDCWYGCLTGAPDLYPDVGISRLSGTSASMILHQAKKIVNYETNPPAGSWFTKTILAAHREQAPGKYVGCSEQIAAGPLGSSSWTIHKQHGHVSGVTNTTVSNFINGGVGIVNYRGHGSNTGWVNGWCSASGEYNAALVNSLTNGHMTPIVFNIACYNGNFKTTCLQEAWMRAPKGAVASLGAILPSYTIPNHDYDKELYRAIFQDGATNIYAFWYKAATKIIAMGTYGQKNAKMYWWGGDCATNVWSKAPGTLTVTHPTSISTGPGNVSITVRDGSAVVSLARVCLYRDNSGSVVATTGKSGLASFAINPTTTGTIKVTVTAKDYLPYQGTIAITGGTPASYIVSPQAYTKVEGGSNNTYPFSNTPFSYMQIHDDLAGKARTISEISFRGDGILGGRAAFSPTLSLWLSTAATPSEKASSTFAKNHGPDLKQVLNNVKVNFPATPSGPGPVAFTHILPFAKTPFTYGGKGSLAWEVRISATTATSSSPLDAFSSSSRYKRFGLGGQASDQTMTCCHYGYIRENTAKPGNMKLYIYAYNLAKSQPYTWMIGVGNSAFGGIKLPFDLSFLGGKGNSLYIDASFFLPGKTSSTGTINNSGTGYFDFPVSPPLSGLPIYSQVICMDPGNKAFPLVFSDGCGINYPRAEPVCRIYAAGSATATTGTMMVSNGLITRFTY